MEIVVDLYKVGYVLGSCTSRVIRYAGAVKILHSGYRQITKVAAEHKIDSCNVDVVSKNLFDCISFID